jgi:hypothetical protein
VWLGPLPSELLAAQNDVLHDRIAGFTPPSWDELVCHGEVERVAEQLVTLCRSTGTTALNLRVHMPGIDVHTVRRQIELIGQELLPRLRASGFAAAPRLGDD